jgi:DNA-binding XRE family transcriptional regulator
MQTNNHKIVDYDAVLDAKFGKEGTPERAHSEEAAYSFYSGQILLEARKEAKVTQAELAERTQTTKSYISKIENGVMSKTRFVNNYSISVTKALLDSYRADII